ncbi:MAG: lectin-like protein [Pseudomonadota bacterium]
MIRILWTLSVFLVATTCSCSDQNPRTQTGTQGGPCFADNRCNPGLVCISGLCTKEPDAQVPDIDSSLPKNDVGANQDSVVLIGDAESDQNIPDTFQPDTGVDALSHETTAPIPDITIPQVCGDGVVSGKEACDDGNTFDGDNCNADCTLACPSGKTLEHHCYVAMKSVGGQNWPEAQHFCETKGMHLVTILDAIENVFVRGKMGVSPGNKIWLGLNDQSTEGSWRWINGESVAFTNWRTGEPNNALGGEDCAALWNSGDTYQWGDISCVDTKLPWTICETEVDAPTQVCGNQLLEGAEICDDGDYADGNECSATCMRDCTGGRTFELNCYILLPEADWATGLLNCQALSKPFQYAAISSANEFNFIKGYRDEIAPGKFLWIGLNDQATEGTWIWQNNEQVLFTFWEPLQPDDASPGEDCCATDTYWYDHTCSSLHVPVCENL